MTTLTFRSDPAVDRALDYLRRRDGLTTSAITREAILRAARTARQADLLAESEALRDDQDDLAEARRVMAEMAAISAW
ncbi:MAG: hypothetical protein LBK42_07190 [Propionibacteriaceae bacterium]|jgi:predicted transcriptional regulator|nr:hypothetical protein [Propionibacteriaceae bacterium]